jgi:PAS domain S-box-containing protein
MTEFDPSVLSAASPGVGSAAEGISLYKDILETLDVLVHCAAPDGSILFVNRAWRETLGYREDETRKLNLFALVHPDSEPHFRAIVQRTLAGETLPRVEVAFVARDGRVIFLEGSCACRFVQGKPVALHGSFRDVTARRQPPEQDHAWMAAILESCRFLIVVLNARGQIIHFNKTCEAITGHSFAAVRGKPLWELIALPSEKELVQKAFAQLDGDFPRGMVDHWKARDGGQRVIEWMNTLVRGPDRAADRVVCVGIDITERERAEYTLRETESRHRLLLEQVPAVLWTTDRELNFTTGIGAGLAHLGLKPGQLQMVGLSLYTYFHTNDPNDPNIAPHFRALAGERAEWDTQWLGRDFHAVVEPFHDVEGSIIGTIGIALDVTERRRAEEALRESNDFLRMSQQIGNVGSWKWDMRADRLEFSENMYRLCGLDPTTFDGTMQTALQSIYPADIPTVVAAIQRARATGEPTPMEYRLVRPDNGALRTMWARAQITLDSTGEPVEGIGTIIDITDRKQVEEQLRESAERLRLAVQASNVGLWDWDLQTNRVIYSPEWKSQLGYQENEIGNDFEEWQCRVHPDDLGPTLQRIHRYLERPEGVHEVEFRMRHKDGSWRWIYARGEVFLDTEGKPVRMMGCHMDITERKRAEDQIRASLEEKGVMLLEIHHRVKNNLQVIQSLLSLQMAQMKEAAGREMLRETHNRVRAMALTHAQLYQEPNLARIDVAAQFREIATALFRSYGMGPDRVRLSVEVPPEVRLPLTKAIPCGLIVNELLANALKHAFPMDRPGLVRIFLAADAAGHCTLIVADNGVGISPTVNVAHPTSLGLQIVRSLVEQLGGILTVNEARGTEFRIEFPFAE